MVKALVVMIVLGIAAPARADTPNRLDEARAAIEAVRYDRARTLLLAALQAGGNSPRELAEIYRLSAMTATVLGDAALAESYYRRWLALEPDAALSADVAPKLRKPFEAVRADMALRGKLDVTSQAAANGVDVRVASDPMQMAVVAALDGTRTPIVDGAAHLTAPPNARTVRVAILDQDGNTVAELDVALPTARAPATAVQVTATSPTPQRPWTRRASTWAIASASLAVTGLVLTAIASNNGTNTIITDNGITLGGPSEPFHTLATISYVGAGACAITAIVFAASRPAAKTVVAPTASATTVGATLVTSW